MSEPTPMPDLHLLPGDAHPGLLDGWCGPVLYYLNFAWTQCAWGFVGAKPAHVRLDLHRPECIDRVIRVLAAGVRCERCRGSGCVAAFDGDALDCSHCEATGYSIAPADLAWTRDLPAWQAGPILAASVLRVVAGEGHIQRLIPPWVHVPKYDEWTREGKCYTAPGTGWWFHPRMERIAGGPETGEAGKAAADAAALAAGYALDNGDRCLIPLTNGAIARVETP